MSELSDVFHEASWGVMNGLNCSPAYGVESRSKGEAPDVKTFAGTSAVTVLTS